MATVAEPITHIEVNARVVDQEPAVCSCCGRQDGRVLNYLSCGHILTTCDRLPMESAQRCRYCIAGEPRHWREV